MNNRWNVICGCSDAIHHTHGRCERRSLGTRASLYGSSSLGLYIAMMVPWQSRMRYDPLHPHRRALGTADSNASVDDAPACTAAPGAA